MFQLDWNNKPLIFLAHYLPYHPGCRFTWPVRDVAALCWPGAIEKLMKICEQRDLHCHPFPFYLWRFAPPKSWTPCRNKLMKCLSLRVHLLDHLTSRLFGKGVTRSSRVLRSLMLTQANGPKRSKAQLLVQHQRGDGFIESYAILCKVELVMVVYVTSHPTRWYWSLSHDMSVREFWHCNYPWHLLHTLNPLPQHPNLFWFFTRFQLCLIISYTFSTQQSCEGAYCFQSSTFAIQVGLLGSCTFYHLCWTWVKSKSFPLCCWLSICPLNVSCEQQPNSR